MKKIKLVQPKYIIPLLVLPFIYVFYFLFADSKTKVSTAQLTDKDFEGLNTEIPNAQESKNLSRLGAYQEALAKKLVNSNMNDEILDKNYNKSLDEQDGGALKMDSIRNSYKEATEKRRRIATEADASREKLVALTNKKKQDIRGERAPDKKASKANDEMADFKAQMRYLDSMQHPEKYRPETNENQTTRFAHKIEKNKARENAHFNTIKANRDETMIMAILDEGIKAWEGSRVRVRLLEPIFIDGNLLEKGQYLYGICSGFSDQRLLITIESVVVQDQILPLDISLYDNDGIEGIYIPSSSFRTFTKELGAQSNGNVEISDTRSNNSTQALYQSLSQAFRSSTRAVQRALRKNKASLKYNTEVYLVNNNINKQP